LPAAGSRRLPGEPIPNQEKFEMKKLVLGITVLLVIALMIGVGVFKLGLIPVNFIERRSQ
jgi:hypothetical protein